MNYESIQTLLQVWDYLILIDIFSILFCAEHCVAIHYIYYLTDSHNCILFTYFYPHYVTLKK